MSQAATVVAGNSTAIAPNSSSWAWDGTEHAELRAALEDGANFGPAGRDTSDTITTVDLVSADAASLAGVDIFVSSWWRDVQSAPFEADIVEWFLAGGDLLLLQDGTDRDGISTRLGFETIGGGAGQNTVSGVLANGPHGVVTEVSQAGSFGRFDNDVITGLGGEIFAQNSNGQATIVGFAEGAFGATSGRLLAFADVDLISGNFGGADFDPLNAKGTLALNAFSFLQADAAIAPVPLPAGLPLMVAGLGGLAFIRRRRRR
ncbi:VPLPA-CTERM sorting domain-containing protein [Epibacterium sp. SM1969]|uniref:VPLPA-CTERM sorting domain-containing protein n=2 Tax=Tritonibacter aquimaris TaxID=2663379 RepID=A0A844AN99_9RHOB|nr:VPLPA-CTERM sorting domain-containing protein [Tritonibacter aquimaris]